MKANCVDNDPRLLPDHQKNRMSDIESIYPVTPGRVYQILGIVNFERRLLFLVMNDYGDPRWVPAAFFEQVTCSMPSNWKFSLRPGIHATGADLYDSPFVAIWGYRELVEDPQHASLLMEDDPASVEICQSYLEGES